MARRGPDAALPAARRRPPLPRPAPVAILLGALLPGLGQLYVGRPGKALLMLVPIAGLFLGGLALTDFTAVDPDSAGLWGLAHAGIPGPAVFVWQATQGFAIERPLPFLEVGRLYVALAGLLNVVAICDAWGSALVHGDRRARWIDVLGRRRERLRRRQAAGADDAPPPAPTPPAGPTVDDPPSPPRADLPAWSPAS